MVLLGKVLLERVVRMAVLPILLVIGLVKPMPLVVAQVLTQVAGVTVVEILVAAAPHLLIPIRLLLGSIPVRVIAVEVVVAAVILPLE